MRIINLVFLVVISITLGSCKKDVGDCFKSTGVITSEWRESGNIRHIILHNNINLTLIPSDSTGIEISAGKNLLSKIHTEIYGDTLELSNTNSCNWVRDFSKEINAKVYVNNLCRLDYRSTGDVNCNDTIYSDSLIVNVYEGSGSINIMSVTPLLKSAIHYGTADIKISGHTHLSQVYSAGWGLIDNRNMNSNFVYVKSLSTNDIYVNVNRTLSASINGIGNIYYQGNPQNISLDNTGSGKLLKIED